MSKKFSAHNFFLSLLLISLFSNESVESTKDEQMQQEPEAKREIVYVSRRVREKAAGSKQPNKSAIHYTGNQPLLEPKLEKISDNEMDNQATKPDDHKRKGQFQHDQKVEEAQNPLLTYIRQKKQFGRKTKKIHYAAIAPPKASDNEANKTMVHEVISEKSKQNESTGELLQIKQEHNTDGVEHHFIKYRRRKAEDDIVNKESKRLKGSKLSDPKVVKIEIADDAEATKITDHQVEIQSPTDHQLPKVSDHHQAIIQSPTDHQLPKISDHQAIIQSPTDHLSPNVSDHQAIIQSPTDHQSPNVSDHQAIIQSPTNHQLPNVSDHHQAIIQSPTDHQLPNVSDHHQAIIQSPTDHQSPNVSDHQQVEIQSQTDNEPTKILAHPGFWPPPPAIHNFLDENEQQLPANDTEEWKDMMQKMCEYFDLIGKKKSEKKRVRFLEDENHEIDEDEMEEDDMEEDDIEEDGNEDQNPTEAEMAKGKDKIPTEMECAERQEKFKHLTMLDPRGWPQLQQDFDVAEGSSSSKNNEATTIVAAADDPAAAGPLPAIRSRRARPLVSSSRLRPLDSLTPSFPPSAPSSSQFSCHSPAGSASPPAAGSSLPMLTRSHSTKARSSRLRPVAPSRSMLTRSHSAFEGDKRELQRSYAQKQSAKPAHDLRAKANLGNLLESVRKESLQIKEGQQRKEEELYLKEHQMREERRIARIEELRRRIEESDKMETIVIHVRITETTLPDFRVQISGPSTEGGLRRSAPSKTGDGRVAAVSILAGAGWRLDDGIQLNVQAYARISSGEIKTISKSFAFYRHKLHINFPFVDGENAKITFDESAAAAADENRINDAELVQIDDK